ncbi:hypothetical protein [Siculibacillus lacustris]|uniref:hypothetical protein n=1 Tax=Siculibacillus lacustris TaxID=1549641 RepID=UPI0013F153A0|nr:hypothetical protein [Siculibacillus lacustris]
MPNTKETVASAIAEFLSELVTQAESADLEFLAYLMKMARLEARCIAGVPCLPPPTA